MPLTRRSRRTKIDELLQTLQHLEVELHQAETRCNAARLLELLHPDFEEFGRSGHRYSREEIISELSSHDTFPHVSAQDFSVARLSEGLALLTYRSAHVNASEAFERHTLRASLWVLTEDGWKMRFHQGTPTDEFRHPELALERSPDAP